MLLRSPLCQLGVLGDPAEGVRIERSVLNVWTAPLSSQPAGLFNNFQMKIGKKAWIMARFPRAVFGVKLRQQAGDGVSGSCGGFLSSRSLCHLMLRIDTIY